MKALTEQETKLLEALEVVQKEFEALPYHLSPPHGDERGEFRKRIDEAKYIIAIRGMLRDGGHIPNKMELPETELPKKFRIGPSGVII